MALENIFKLIKKLETLVAFQKDCLDSGNWEDYDKADIEIKKLEREIIETKKEE